MLLKLPRLTLMNILQLLTLIGNYARIGRLTTPATGKVKLNRDATMKVSDQKMSICIIERDYKGEVLGYLSSSIILSSHLVVVECLALLRAIEFLLRHGILPCRI